MESRSMDSDYSDSHSNIPFAPSTLPRRHTTTNTRAAVYLIIVTILERCSFFILTMNLPYTLSFWFKPGAGGTRPRCDGDNNNGKFARLDTINVVLLLLFFYICNALFSIIGGWLGDSTRFGRYRTICLSFVFYIMGSASFISLMFVMICTDQSDEISPTRVDFKCPGNFDDNIALVIQWLLLFISFIFISLGYGLCKPNIAPFGADQMREGSKDQLEKFYLYFYACTNIGAAMGFAFGFLQTPSSIALSYFCSFIPCLVLHIICLFLLIIGSRDFIKLEPMENTFKTFFLILKEWFKSFQDRQVINQIGDSRINMLKMQCGGPFAGEEVDAFVDLWRIMPVLLTMLMYWTCYSQLFSLYYFQTFYLKHPDHYPLSLIYIMNPLLILIMVPILDKVVYPKFRLPTFSRMQLGYALAALSLFSAAMIGWDTKWRTEPEQNPKHVRYFHEEDNTTYTTYVSDTSIFYMTPQIVLMSMSEIFAIIASMEFVYVEAPRYMKSFGMGLYFAVNTMGDVLAILLLLVVRVITESIGKNSWICNNLNNGHIDYFFLLLMGFMALNMLVLCVVGYKFKRGITSRQRRLNSANW